MSLIDTIKKLENIKQKYIIEKLENFTVQLAATNSVSTTATPATTSNTSTTSTTSTTTTATPATPATPATATPTAPIKPEEDKKPPPDVGDAKKFEKNIMDSLKWVFIGIGIFVLLLIILGIIYWLMFGSNKEDNIDTIEEQNIYNIPPEPLISPTIASTRPLIATTANNNPDVINDDKNNSIFSFMTSFNKKEELPEIINNEELKVNKTIIPLSSSSSPSSPSSSSSSSSSPSSSSPYSSSSSTTSTSSSSSSSSISSETPISQNNKNESIFSYIDPFSKKDEEIKVTKTIAPMIPEVPKEISPQNKNDESIFSFMSPLSKKDEELKINNSIIPEAKLSSASSLSPNDEKYKLNYIAKK